MFSSWLSRSASSTSRRKAPVRHSESIMVRLRRWVRRGFYSVLVLTLVGVGAVAYSRASDFLYHSSYFKIDEIRILDSTRNEPLEAAEELKQTAELYRGRNLLLLNPATVERRLKALPSVTNVKAYKSYPGTLTIRAKARNALAVLDAGKMYVLDYDGVPIEAVDEDEKNAELPYISGMKLAAVQVGKKIDDPLLGRALDLIARTRIMNPELHAKISEIDLDEKDGITLYLTGGLEVRLGHSDPVELMPYLEEYEKRKLDVNAKFIDLRFPKQLVYAERPARSTGGGSVNGDQ